MSTVLRSDNLDDILKTKMPAVGIDIGGTKIMAGIVNSQGLIDAPVKIPTPSGSSNILNAVLQLIEQFKQKHLVAGVGIATAGIVNIDTGTIIGATGNLPGWSGTPIKQVIESKILLPVHVENDANAAGYAEAHFRQLQDTTCAVVITIGTGIGGSILIKGKLFRGDNYGGGHVGHIKLSMDNKRPCSCGLFDCYEAYASGTGLLVTAREVLASVKSDQSLLSGDLQNLKNENVLDAYAKGDLIARKIVNMWHKHLAIGMASIANALNPHCFILGGGLSPFVDLELVSELLLDNTLPTIGEHLKVYKSELGNTAGLIGAAQLILDKLAKVS